MDDIATRRAFATGRPARRLFHKIIRPLYVFVRERLTELIERSYRIRTLGEIPLEKLAIAGPNRSHYKPAPWLALRRSLRHLSVTPEDVFIDLGSGMGRVVFQAAMSYPFRRVIGVELSRHLHDIAEQNVTRNRHRLRCHDVQLICSDVLSYDLPDDLTVVFLANPFTGDVFSTVVQRLLASFDRHPRALTVIYFNPVEHDRLMSTGRMQLSRRIRGLRPEREWARSNAIHIYSVRPATSDL